MHAHSSVPVAATASVTPREVAHGRPNRRPRHRGRWFGLVAGVLAAMAVLSTGGCAGPATDRLDPTKSVMAAQPAVTALSAALEIDGLPRDQTGRCGATVVTSTKLLTAAHCLLMPFPPQTATDVPQPAPPAQVRARIGSADRTSGGTVRAVTRIDIDPEFTLRYPAYPAHDLAVLRLDQPLAGSAVATLGDVAPGTSTRTLVWSTADRTRGTHPVLPSVATYAPAVILDRQRCPRLTQADQTLCFDAAAGAGGTGSVGSGLFRVEDPAAIRLVGVISAAGNDEQTTGVANPVFPQSPWLHQILTA